MPLRLVFETQLQRQAALAHARRAFPDPPEKRVAGGEELAASFAQVISAAQGRSPQDERERIDRLGAGRLGDDQRKIAGFRRGAPERAFHDLEHPFHPRLLEARDVPDDVPKVDDVSIGIKFKVAAGHVAVASSRPTLVPQHEHDQPVVSAMQALLDERLQRPPDLAAGTRRGDLDGNARSIVGEVDRREVAPPARIEIPQALVAVHFAKQRDQDRFRHPIDVELVRRGVGLDLHDELRKKFDDAIAHGRQVHGSCDNYQTRPPRPSMIWLTSRSR